jgi:outer membrane protein assembly factor BamA
MVLSPSSLRADAAAIYATGLVDDVVITARREGTGAIVFVKLEERPRIVGIEFNGSREAHSRIARNASMFSYPEDGSLFSAPALAAANQRLKSALTDAGWLDAEVKAVAERVGDQQVRLTVSVTEGARAQISAVVFEGARGGREATLRKLVNLEGETLEKAKLDAAVFTAVAFYLDNGYPSARVDPPSIKRGNGAASAISFKVEEGALMRIGTVRFSGIGGAHEVELLRRIQTKPKAIARRDIMMSDKAAVTSFFRERGEMAEVTLRPAVDDKSATVDLLFEVASAPRP